MSDPARMVSAPQDAKGRLVLIFVGAVLLPSVALSYLSFQAIPRQAEAMKLLSLKAADRLLFYVEEDLERKARILALEAARIVGPERLLDGRREVIQAALLNAGIPPDTFDALRLEGSSPLSKLSIVLNRTREVDTLREALNVMNLPSAPDGLESLPLAGEDSKMAGVLRYRYSCAYIHRT